VGERLDDRDVGTEGAPHAGELRADDAATEDDRRARHPVEGECLVGRQHAAADLQTGQGPRVRAGAEHDVLARQGAVAHLDGVRAGELAVARHDLDLAGLDEPLQALVEAPDHVVLVLVHAAHVDALEVRVHPEARTLAGVVRQLGGVQEGLGRDATSVEAGATHLVGLDQGDGLAQFGGAQCGGVAAAASAQDHDVESGAVVGHVRTPRRVWGLLPAHLVIPVASRRTV